MTQFKTGAVSVPSLPSVPPQVLLPAPKLVSKTWLLNPGMFWKMADERENVLILSYATRKFPRIDVFASFRGSQANPMDGPRFRKESRYNCPGCQLNVVLLSPHPNGAFGRSILLELVTRGESFTSHLRPRSRTRLGRIFHESWPKKSYSGIRKSACRSVPGCAQVFGFCATTPCVIAPTLPSKSLMNPCRSAKSWPWSI